MISDLRPPLIKMRATPMPRHFVTFSFAASRCNFIRARKFNVQKKKSTATVDPRHLKVEVAE